MLAPNHDERARVESLLEGADAPARLTGDALMDLVASAQLR